MATHDWPRGPATSPFPRRLCSSAHQKVYDRFPASFVLHHVVPITLTLWQWILIDSIIPAQCRESEHALERRAYVMRWRIWGYIPPMRCLCWMMGHVWCDPTTTGKWPFAIRFPQRQIEMFVILIVRLYIDFILLLIGIGAGYRWWSVRDLLRVWSFCIFANKLCTYIHSHVSGVDIVGGRNSTAREVM